MSVPNRNAVEKLQAFIDAYFDELRESVDGDLVSDPRLSEIRRSKFKEFISAAKVEAGRRRLAAARRMIGMRAHHTKPLSPVDISEARRFIAEAANDARITLAARDLIEMPDEDVERIYRQLKELDLPPGTK